MHVLCVDGDAERLDRTAAVLDDRLPGATVHTGTRLDDALAVVESSPLDCVVTDHDVPGGTGIDVLRSVRETRPDLPVILVTADGSEAVADDAADAGVTDTLTREAGDAELAARISRAVAAFRAEHWDDARPTESTAIRRIADLLSADGDAPERLGRVAEFLPAALGRPTDAVARIAVGDEEFTSPEYEPPTRSHTARGVTVDGTELVLEVGYTADSAADAPLGPDERDVIETIGRLLVAALDRERVVADLRETDRRLRTVLENTTAVMYMKDREGRYVFVNGEYERLFDRRAEEVVGRTDEEIHPPEMAEHVTANDRHVLETDDPLEVEERIDVGGDRRRAGDSEERVFLSLKVPVEGDDGETEGVFGVSTDITERRDRERQLEALNHTIPRLLDADSHADVARLGVEAARDILGLEANAIHLYDEEAGGLAPVAATDALRELIGDPPVFEGPDSIAWRVFEEGTVAAVDDVRRDPDVYDPTTPIRSELFLPLGEYGVLIAGSRAPSEFDAQDETVGELLARHLVTAFEQVDNERRLRDREAELEERNARLEEFASMMSHDLRTPVSIAVGNLELYRDRGGDDSLDAIERALNRIQELITDLTALARYGSSENELGPVSIANVAEEAWETIDAASATLTTEDVVVTADERQLKLLFENLFRNSVEHGSTDSRTQSGDSVEHGSTNSRPKADDSEGSEIPRTTGEAGDSVEHGSTDNQPQAGDGSGLTVRVGPLDGGFYVEDTGRGIPPSERDRVFDHGYTTGDGGSGVGLTIVNRVAQVHGWDVSVGESREGGARFEFRDGGAGED